MNNLSFLFAAKTLNEESIKLLDGDLAAVKAEARQKIKARQTQLAKLN